MASNFSFFYQVCCWVLLIGISHAKEPNHLIIGVEKLNYFPHYSHEYGKLVGYTREVFDAFAKTHHYTIEYRLLAVSELYTELLQTQSIDFKYPDNPQWNSKGKENIKVHYSQSVSQYIDGIIVMPAIKSKGLPFLKNLGTIKNFTPWGYTELIESGQIQLHESETMIELLSQVMFGKIDGAYVNIAVARYHLNYTIHSPKALVFNNKLPYIKSSYYLSTVKHPKTIKIFNQFLTVEAQLIDKLRKKYNVSVEF
ncbi:transporter substrate-binding domain-containing protein [Endozoicomonas sp. SM1973]|uniref:Transporter substrate-binding domain-containing protein n=1 Tax=Spartinivicinus marinus TaxID=2994442 RepID=A0A853IMN2_9GAMM|nr:transporter substrate-binding domain-containing protein [Spartinivicinus marinus]NYZ69046.1 transporter substrate-binding domain-containing protein [Spartinivicinus marinus]